MRSFKRHCARMYGGVLTVCWLLLAVQPLTFARWMHVAVLSQAMPSPMLAFFRRLLSDGMHFPNGFLFNVRHDGVGIDHSPCEGRTV